SDVNTINPDQFEVYGIKVGDSSDKIIENLGVPLDKNIRGDVLTYVYSKLRFMIKNDKVIHIESGDIEFKTDAGVGVSDTFKDIYNHYKDFNIRGFGVFNNRFLNTVYVVGENISLAFNFDDLTYENPEITKISIGETR